MERLTIDRILTTGSKSLTLNYTLKGEPDPQTNIMMYSISVMETDEDGNTTILEAPQLTHIKEAAVNALKQFADGLVPSDDFWYVIDDFFANSDNI